MVNGNVAEVIPEKKRRLIEGAIVSILRNGYAGTSVDDICRTANVTKGSFFHYFSSKEDIARSAMDAWSAHWQQILEAADFPSVPNGLDRLRRLFDVMEAAYLGSPVGPGCVVGTVAQEVGASTRSLGDPCESHFDRWKVDVVRLLEDARGHSPQGTPFDVDSVAEFLLVVVQGTMLVAKTRQSTASIPSVLSHCRRYVLSLYEPLAHDQPSL